MRILRIVIPAAGHLGKGRQKGPDDGQRRHGDRARQKQPTKTLGDKSSGHAVPPVVTPTWTHSLRQGCEPVPKGGQVCSNTVIGPGRDESEGRENRLRLSESPGIRSQGTQVSQSTLWRGGGLLADRRGTHPGPPRPTTSFLDHPPFASRR